MLIVMPHAAMARRQARRGSGRAALAPATPHAKHVFDMTVARISDPKGAA